MQNLTEILTEILEAHRLWVDTDGEQGARADLDDDRHLRYLVGMSHPQQALEIALTSPPTDVALIVDALARHGWNARTLESRIQLLNSGDGGRMFAVTDRLGDPFIVGSLCPAAAFPNAEVELLREAESDGVVSVIAMIASDTEDFRTLRLHPGTRRYVSGPRPDPWSKPSSTLPLLVHSGSGSNALRPLDRRVEQVLFEVHSHMRDIDGLHAPEAVDELCKLLFLKTYDERCTVLGQPFAMQASVYGTSDEYACAVRRLYRKALAEEEQRRGLGQGALSHIWGALSLSDTALVRCVDQLASYSISSSSLDVKGRAFQNVIAPTVRAGMGQYFTPERIGTLMIDVLAPARTERTLDPFAGSAHFLSLAARRWSAEPAQRHRADGEALYGIEKSERMMRVAWTDLMLHEVSGIDMACGDALGSQAQFPDHRLSSFDVVVTNPPFGSVLRDDAIAALGKYETSAGRGSTAVEVLALERAVRFLRPGGRIGIVLPDGLLGNQRALGARRWVAAQIAVRAIVSLPAETFSPFGANVKASILFGRRLLPGEELDPKKPVFLAKIEDVGHDASGRSTPGADVATVASALIDFLNTEGW